MTINKRCKCERASQCYLAMTLCLALYLSLGGCDSGVREGEDGLGLAPPLATDDLGIVEGVELGRLWYLIGNDRTPGNDVLELTVSESSAASLDVWIDRIHVSKYEAVDGWFVVNQAIGDLGPGEHDVLLSIDEGISAHAQFSFYRTHPLYVFVTNDWDDSDNDFVAYTRQEALHDDHPELLLTHFVGPYTFTDNAVSAKRREEIVGWLNGMRDNYGDEIGLHVHPYCNFVRTTAVSCRTVPSFRYPKGDNTGYTVFLSSYTEEETTTLFEASKKLFEENGLGIPISFRAGGWTARENTMLALEKTGFVADTSANNWSRLEEWEKYTTSSLYPWNEENWAPINDTSQPYYPSIANILETTHPLVGVLEVPDNGILVDYVTAQEMIDIFEMNWGGEALLQPTSYVIGYHPSSFSVSFYSRLDKALEHVDQFLASKGKGPVVYEILSSSPLVWPQSD